MVDFCSQSKKERINQRNNTNTLADILDWKRMGIEYVKSRWIAIYRKWLDISFGQDSNVKSTDNHTRDFLTSRDFMNTNLFEDSERNIFDTDILLDELKALGIKGARKTGVKYSVN